MDAIQHIQMWWRCILAKRIYSKLKDEWQIMREVKVKQNQEAAATKIQAVIRGKIQKGKSDFDLLTIRQQVQLDKEVAQLKVEAAELEALYLESDREHIRFLEELEEERQKEAVLHEERLRSTFTNLNSSFSSLPSVASLLASPGKDSRASSLGLGSDEIEKQRRANKRLRKVVCKMETEVKALKQNVETLSISNEDACDAVVHVKNAYLKQVVKNTRIEKETKNFLDEMESQMYWQQACLNQYEIEKKTSSMYFNTAQSIVKIVKKEIPDSELAADIERIFSLNMMAEEKRKKKMNRQDSFTSLNSSTIATECSDSDNSFDENSLTVHSV